MKKMNLILVFDAYKVSGGTGSVMRYGNIYVVYTKEAETADNYIERTTTLLSREYNVRVATSDGLEQVIIMSKGAVRVSATEFYEEVKMQSKAITESLEQIKPVKNNMLIDNLDKETAAFLEQLRRMK
jgi:predicted RNA-binding protein with PIN domain